MAEGKLPPHATPTPTPTPAPIHRSLPPTLAEQAFDRNRAEFARTAKYPIREHAVLTPAQLAAARAGLEAHGGVSLGRARWPVSRAREDHRPLTATEIEAARARLAEEQSWDAVDAWLSSIPSEGPLH